MKKIKELLEATNPEQTMLENVHTLDELERDIEEIFEDVEIVSIKKNKKTIIYYNVAAAFDIETTSFYISTGTIKPTDKKDKSKAAFMYIWQMMINGYIVIGRTWDELHECIEILKDKLGLSEELRLPMYIHNSGYEFQFMRKYFDIEDLFATDSRTPIRFLINGIEFRDSYILSGYALRNLHKDLEHKVYKKEGDLDYKKIRHSKTPLTNDELLYCIYDVYVVSVYIWEKLERGEDVTKIPFTKTGYVREDVRKNTVDRGDKDGFLYYSKIKKLTIDPLEYRQLKLTYQGGFTHGNTLYMDDTLEDVTSMDFTSSYPTVLISERYPMSKGVYVILPEDKRIGDAAIEVLDKLRSKDRCFMCQIRFTNLRCKISQECYISESKCESKTNVIVENGRIYEADEIITNITDVDLDIIRRVYEWDDVKIASVMIYKLEYLPKPLVETILDYYIGKTTLKDVEEKAIEYGIKKSLLNSIYGMMCQDPLQPSNIYVNEEWIEGEVNATEELKKYNTSHKRTTFYPWGVWCCAYARRNLWLGGILPLGDDYIYSDTDSVKFLNYEKNKWIFDKYNKEICRKLEIALEYHGLDKNMYRPKTIKGKEKPLGVWDYDGHYKRFKTVGAKRYLVETDDGEIKQTIAGLPKSAGKEFFQKQKDPFEVFRAGDKKHALKISASETGKNCLTYIDYEQSGEITDYLGEVAEWEAQSAIHMEETAFSMSLSDEFLYRILNKRLDII